MWKDLPKAEPQEVFGGAPKHRSSQGTTGRLGKGAPKPELQHVILARAKWPITMLPPPAYLYLQGKEQQSKKHDPEPTTNKAKKHLCTQCHHPHQTFFCWSQQGTGCTWNSGSIGFWITQRLSLHQEKRIYFFVAHDPVIYFLSLPATIFRIWG